ncbi:unnamed protein product [Meloidogyne enterolobii]|uniref:Uncharacterized protein n=1 Tax=Meloidogyne enterolobii TaxID=390850 RepID=A0ACB0Y1R4_MELEN
MIFPSFKNKNSVYDFATQIMNLGGSIIGEKEFPTNNGYGGYGRALKMKENSLNQRFGATPMGLPYSEYGGGSSTSQDRSSPYDPYDLGYGSSLYSNGYGNNVKREGPNSNIEGILKALVRSGAKKAEVAEPDGTTSFLSQFFGR